MPHVTFIHGISNKPAAEKLLAIWRRALAQDHLGNHDGIDLGASGVTSSMVYWADVLYDKPLEGDSIEEETLREGEESTLAETPTASIGSDPGTAWQESLLNKERQLVEGLRAKWASSMRLDEPLAESLPTAVAEMERIPLPWFLKQKLMNQLLRDVHHYLFNVSYSPRPGTTYQVQDVIRQRVITALQEGAAKPGPHIVVSHSMGTVIAYDCLKRVEGCPSVDGLMTIGSPLGLDEVQDKLIPDGTVGHRFPTKSGFPERVKGSWVNVYDMLDPVTGLDGDIANDFQQNGQEVIKVIKEQNWGAWRHNIVKYLAKPMLRAALAEQLGL